jgi:hexosaminidase
MRREGLRDVDELQSYFIHRIEAFLNAHGRKLLGWDEILDGGLAPNATVMSWRGVEGGLKAMAMGHRAIMTPGEYCYFDAYQDAPHTQPEAFGGYLPLQKVYGFEPLPDTLDAGDPSLLYGIQANLFAEYIPTETHMEYMAYPRVLALAEVAWSQPANKCYEDFRIRAMEAAAYLRAKGYNAFRLEDEVGNRPGADRPLQHLGVGKQVAYVDGSRYYSGYTAGGDGALVDGVRGGWTYGDKCWQGFLGRKGVDVVIDLEEVMPLRSVSADFMQICGPGVYMPSQVIVSVSDDGEAFTVLRQVDNEVVRDEAVTFKTFGWEGNATGRYVRYQAVRSDFGGFLFVDEVVIR